MNGEPQGTICRSFSPRNQSGHLINHFVYQILRGGGQFIAYPPVNENFTIGIATDSTTEIHTISTELQQLDADFSGSAGGEGERSEDDD